jgi:hypothetical protein
MNGNSKGRLVQPTAAAVAAAVVGLVIALIGVMPAAHGDTRTFHDSTTDKPSSMGIRWVKVKNGWRADGTRHNNLKIVTRIGTLPPPQDSGAWTTLFIDTRPGNAGPEYRVVMVQDTGLYRVNGWRDHGTAVPPGCGSGRWGVHSHYGQSGGHYNRLVVSIKRACIAGAGKVRVSVHTTTINRPKHQDWAKARKTFYPWVRR